MTAMMKRNVKIFFKDKTAVLFSLLTVFIIIGLYVIFLKSSLLSAFDGLKEVDFMINSWVLSGILAVATVTTTLGALGAVVEDREKKIFKDFQVAPVSRWSITGSYIMSAVVVGLVMAVISFGAAELFVMNAGGELLGLIPALKVIGLLTLSVVSSCSMLFFAISFLSSQKTYTTVTTIVGTLIGFLTGIYIPIGQFPESVQTLMKIFPVSHTAAMIRQIMMEVPMKRAFADVPVSYVEEFKLEMGVYYQMGGTTITPAMSVIFLGGLTLVFFVLSVWKISAKAK